jgi:hypothetical protein
MHAVMAPAVRNDGDPFALEHRGSQCRVEAAPA